MERDAGGTFLVEKMDIQGKTERFPESSSLIGEKMINANLTIYAGWKLRIIHIVAKMLGVLVKVDGIPYGCNKAHIRYWCGDGVQSGECTQFTKTNDNK